MKPHQFPYKIVCNIGVDIGHIRHDMRGEWHGKGACEHRGYALLRVIWRWRRRPCCPRDFSFAPSPKVLDGLILLHLPKLAAHLAAEGVVMAMFAMAWFLAAFTKDFPVGLTARGLDCFLGADGPKVLHRVALALLQRA